METYDFYPPEVLEGKGLLISNSQDWLSTVDYELMFYNLDDSKLGRVDKNKSDQHFIYIQTQSEKTVAITFPLPVYKQDQNYYYLTPMYVGCNSLATKIKKEDAERLHWRYHPIKKLLEVFYKYPDYFNNPFGMEMIQPLAQGHQDFQHNILKKAPLDSSEYTEILIPSKVTSSRIISPDSVQIEALADYWFHLNMKLVYIYNSSSDPNVCARSRYEASYGGYWKAPCNPLGFPIVPIGIIESYHISDIMNEIEN